MLSRLKIDRIDVEGHTDTVPIASRSRHIYDDNTALSFARARSVGRYLAAALRLPPESLYLTGCGEKKPIATNSTAEGKALNRRVEVKVSATDEIKTTILKVVKDRSGIQKTETSGSAEKPAGDNQVKLTPLQADKGLATIQTAESSTETVPTTENSSDPAADSKNSLKEKTPITTKEKTSAAVSAVKAEQAILVSALVDGIVNYRIKLAGFRKTPKMIMVTLVAPKSFLYINGTSRLSGSQIADPANRGSVLTYNIADLPVDKKFDLRLQAVIDGDDQTESLASSVTVVIADADGKPLDSLTASSELTDNIEEINETDTPETVEASSSQPKDSNEDSAKISEYVEKVPVKATSVREKPVESDSGLHVLENEGVLSPANGSILVSRINAVRIVLNSSLSPVLSIDGKVVATDRIGFSMKDPKTGKSLYTFIGVDFGDAGEHLLQLKGIDTFGVVRFDNTAKITLSGDISTIKLVSAEGNIADGKTPLRVRIQLFDKDDKPVPANAELTLKSDNLRPLSVSGIVGQVTNNGLIKVDSEGWISFQPVTSSGSYRGQISYNKAVLDFETYAKPKMRDWILVGLAEGTVGYNNLSGHMENAQSSGQQEGLYDKERLALYAKGTIKGEWLLTMAYDSAREKTGIDSNGLFQTIDPGSYYTIYGDASSQMYDAASQKKLYLKIERDQFYALFGDYDTGLTVTELSKYSRRMNGIKSEYHAKDYDVTVFGSETGQSFAKDEIRGDGTSGLYRLSKSGIVINSEKIIIETRDRFHSEVVTSSMQMNRFTDYSIDYDNGTIFFKSPVSNRDEQLNPVYIVIDYEIRDAGKNALTYGGHATSRMMNGKVQVGGSYVHEGHLKGSGDLYGADATAIIAPGTKARAEFATTSDDTGVKRNGSAWLAEVTHTGKSYDGKAYYREQEEGFGLGQQKGSEAGTRKFGADGTYRADRNITVSSQAYRQYTLATGATRDFMEALVSWNEKQYSLRSGLRFASDTLPGRTSASSVLGTVGASWKSANQKLTLRADHDQALLSKNENTDFPTRTIIGADYQLTKSALVFAQEELTYGAAENTNTTRIGVKSSPWSGATLNSSVSNDIRENGERTFANVGLTQKLQINPRWIVDGGLDHSETIRNKAGYSLNPAVAPASGGEEFTAVSLGANYTEKKLSWSNRAEYRNSRTDDKWGIISGVINEQGLNWGWTAKLQLLHTQSAGGSSKTDADLRFGLAYRPPVTQWIVLDRLDLIATDEKGAATSTQGKRIVNNLNANYRPDRQTQISIQYGAKYVLEKIDDKEYSGYTDLVGIEGRYDLNKEWDLGLRSSILHTWATSQFAYSFGPSIGYNVMDNAWISLGYNFAGFKDKDFSSANYTAEGPFIQFRFKFDQNSVKDALKALNQ